MVFLVPDVGTMLVKKQKVRGRSNFSPGPTNAAIRFAILGHRGMPPPKGITLHGKKYRAGIWRGKPHNRLGFRGIGHSASS